MLILIMIAIGSWQSCSNVATARHTAASLEKFERILETTQSRDSREVIDRI